MVARQKVGFLIKNSLKRKAEYYKNGMITAMIIFGIVVTKENLARAFFHWGFMLYVLQKYYLRE